MKVVFTVIPATLPVWTRVPQLPDDSVSVLDVLGPRKDIKDLIPIDDIVAIVLVAWELQDICAPKQAERLGRIHP
ncbi:hypothetical protein B0O80DRAFT_258742 [Mortierella sp. GBAus27b]|nr:hypothetical protein B0O80DRAFT_258742 [Mortierella sp. GBAus27b]